MPTPEPVVQPDHRVLLYRHDAQLVAAAGDFAAGALNRGGAAVLVGTGSHLELVEQWAALVGADLARSASERRYHRIDLAEVLPGLDESPDPVGTFERVILETVDLIPPDSRPVRVFGDVVAALWERGDIPLALGIEDVGTRLAAERGIEILCAYPESVLATDGEIGQACSCHAGVLEAAPIPPADATDPLVLAASPYPATPASCRAVRILVRSTLSRFGLDDALVDSAELVASELAANAVRHVASPFSVRVTHAGEGTVRVAVTDPEAPPAGEAGMPVSRTHGLGIISTLSARWGVEETRGGKVVWADIAG